MIARKHKLTHKSDLTATNVEQAIQEIALQVPKRVEPFGTFQNIKKKRGLDVSTATVEDVANVLGTLISDLQKAGMIRNG